MHLPLETPPQRLCILRLSALGDICHTLPVIRTLQHHWPDTQLTWIIGRTEHQLVGEIPGIEFITFDKGRRWRSLRALQRRLRGRSFDALLHMQMSLRASLISLLVRSPVKLGFDRARAKDAQWCFTNYRIAPHTRQHVMDSLFGFSTALGIPERVLRWDLPIDPAARDWAAQVLPDTAPGLVISPCASKAYRNWSAAGYAAVADYATRHHGLRVVLSGGPSAPEQAMGEAILSRAAAPIDNYIGRTTIPALLALLARARVVLAPDSGPAHMANAVGTPVIGLYACTNPDRARPYNYPQYVVNHYPAAVRARYGREPAALPWGIRVRDPQAMERIQVAEVCAKLDQVLAAPD